MNEIVAISYNKDCIIKYYLKKGYGKLEFFYDVIRRGTSSQRNFLSGRCLHLLSEELGRDEFGGYTVTTDKKEIALKLMELELSK